MVREGKKINFAGSCQESPALWAGMNRHNSKIIKLHFRDAPRCARGASQEKRKESVCISCSKDLK